MKQLSKNAINLKEQRLKIAMIKTKNESILKSNNEQFNLQETFNGKQEKLRKTESNSKNIKNQFVTHEEFFTVENCFQKSLKLIKLNSKLKNVVKSKKFTSLDMLRSQDYTPAYNKLNKIPTNKITVKNIKNNQITHIYNSSSKTRSNFLENKESNSLKNEIISPMTDIDIITINDSGDENITNQQHNQDSKHFNMYSKCTLNKKMEKSKEIYQDNFHILENTYLNVQSQNKENYIINNSSISMMQPDDCLEIINSDSKNVVKNQKINSFSQENKKYFKKIIQDNGEKKQNEFKNMKYVPLINQKQAENKYFGNQSKKLLINEVKSKLSSSEKTIKMASPLKTFKENSQINKYKGFHKKLIKSSYEIVTIEENTTDHDLNAKLTSNSFIHSNLHRNLDVSYNNSNWKQDSSERIDNPFEMILPILDFNEEPVDFVIPKIHMMETVTPITEKKMFESEGITIKTGKWSKEEEAILKKNMENFKTQFGISKLNTCLLLGRDQKYTKNLNEYRILSKFLKAKHFYVRLGKDLNQRTLLSIYGKAQTVFDPLRNGKKLLSRDISTLNELQKRYGNRWNLIGRKMGVAAYICSKTWYRSRKCVKKGKWSRDEVEKLIDAIKSVSKESDLSRINFERLPWSEISDIVKTRYPEQCWDQWHMNLSTKLTSMNYHKFNKKYIAKLIYILKQNCQVKEEVDIDWKKVYKHFKNDVPSLSYLRKKWIGEVKTKAPKHLRTSYPELVNFLFEMFKKDIDVLKRKNI